MNKLKAKLKKQGGFTLVEMLIVVAIIAILIAISIPLINGALEKARDATDQANERSAKAEALLVFMVGISADDTTSQVTAGGTAVGSTYVPGTAFTANYDAKDGRLITGTPTGYGKCTTGTHITGGATQKSGGNVDAYLAVSVSATGAVTLEWK